MVGKKTCVKMLHFLRWERNSYKNVGHIQFVFPIVIKFNIVELKIHVLQLKF